MMLKTRGIVLRSMKYRESSLILDVYTETHGLRSYLVNGVRSARSRMSAGLFQVMSLIEMVAYHREDRSLNRLREVRPAYVFQKIPFDVTRGAVGLFIAEIAQKTLREREENPRLFQFLYDTFVYLDATEEPIGNVHLHFLLELSTFLGFMPTGDYSAATPLFDLKEGVFIPGLPGHKYFLDERRSGQLYALVERNRRRAHEVNLSREERRNLLNDLLLYYRLHIEGLPDINAHLILQEVFWIE